MNHPGNISIKDFNYNLPVEYIANYPLEERDNSRLLILKDGVISEDIYRNIASHIPENTLLVFNNTKVVEARLLFQKPSGGVIELFCLEPAHHYKDINTAFAQQETVIWNCLVGGASKWKHGQVLEKEINSSGITIRLQARFISKQTDHFQIKLSWDPASLSFAEVLHFAGAIPLPPYIKRPAEQSDSIRYQTVYAREQGSVAAPTAGLHFTDNIFKDLRNRGIHTEFVTLHVGAGTFKPVQSEKLMQHKMHSEYLDVERDAIYQILGHLEKGIVAVGTTSLRTLESLYWIGCKLITQNNQSIPNNEILKVEQWEPYSLESSKIPTHQALNALLTWLEKNNTERLIAKTEILIAPGYSFKVINGLVTNFHQPQSTLLLLIAALIGENWKKLYEYALQNKFRFLSYGDGCLLFNQR